MDVYLVTGKLGSGQTTISHELANHFNAPYYSVSALLAALAKADSKNSREIVNCLSCGTLVDDKLTEAVFDTIVSSLTGQSRIVLDGYPKTIDQAKHLIRFLREKFPVRLVLIQVNLEDRLILDRALGATEELEKRLKCSHSHMRDFPTFFKNLEGAQKCRYITIHNDKALNVVFSELVQNLTSDDQHS